MNCLSGSTERYYTRPEPALEHDFAPFARMDFMEASARAGELVVALAAKGHDLTQLRDIANAAVNASLEKKWSEASWRQADDEAVQAAYEAESKVAA